MSNKNKQKRTSNGNNLLNGNNLANREVSVTKAEYHHSGPMPDPMTLQRYEDIIPGAAERILVMAEEQAAHRQSIEKTVIKAGSRDSLLGLIAGFAIGMATIISGTIIILQGYLWNGTIVGSAGVVGLVSVFIYGTRSNRRERENKRR